MKATRSKSVRLSIQALEDRSVPAGLAINPPILLPPPQVTAVANLGVLRIVGTDGADNIFVRETSGHIFVSGVAGKFAAAQVQKIEVFGLGGNDIIRWTANSSVAASRFISRAW